MIRTLACPRKRRHQVAVAVTMCLAGPAGAGTDTWVGASGGFWDIAVNWSNGLPGPDSDVELGPFDTIFRTGVVNIDSLTGDGDLGIEGGSLSVAAASSIGSLSFSGGTLAGSGSLSVAGPSTWTGGTMSGPGITTFNGPVTLSGNSDSRVINGGRIVNFLDATTWTNSPGGDNAFGAINASGGAVLNNFGLWTDLISSNPSTIGANGGGATFNNFAAYIKTGTSTTTVAAVFNNIGALGVEIGTFTLIDGGTSTGLIDVGIGATLNFAAGTYTLSNMIAGLGTGTLQVSGSAAVNSQGANAFAGQLSLVGGTFNVDTSFDAPGFNMSGGTLSGNGKVTIAGSSTWAGGTMSGTGTTTFSGPLALVGNTDGRVITGRTVNFAGTTTWTNSPGGVNAFGAVNASGGAVLNNTGTWLDQIASNPSTIGSNAGGAVFNNIGSYVKSGTSTTTFAATFNNKGTLDVDAGTLSLNAGGASTGSIDVAAGATLNVGAGTYALSGMKAGTGTGTLQVSGSGVLNTQGANSFAGQLSMVGGSFNATGTFAASGLNMSAGTLTGTGKVSFAGGGTWAGGTMSGTGTTTFSGPLALVGNTDGRVITGRTVNFAGTTTWTNSPGGVNAFGAVNASGGAVLNNTGTWLDQIASNPSTIGSNAGGAVFNNIGSYVKSGASTTTFAATFNNKGTLDVDAGTLSLNAGGASTGSIDVAAGATLNVGAGTYALSGMKAGTGTGTLQVSGSGVLNTQGANSFAGQLSMVGGSFNATGTFAASGLNMSAGTLTGTGKVSFAGGGTWAGGTMSGTGTTTFSGPLALVGNTDGRIITGRTVNFAGTTTWTNSPGGVNAFGAVNASGGAVLNNTGTWLDQIASNPSTIGSNAGGAVFNNIGSYVKSGASTTNLASIDFVNAGLTDVQAGIIDLPSNFANPGVLQGTGTFATNALTNSGHVAPGESTGTLTIAGNFTQTSKGSLDVQLTDATHFDTLNVTGTASLAGTLKLSCLNCTLVKGQTYTVLNGASNQLQGTFARVVLDGFALNEFQVSYDVADGDVDLTVLRSTRSGGGGTESTLPAQAIAAVPELGSWQLMLLGLIGMAAIRRAPTRRR